MSSPEVPPAEPEQESEEPKEPEDSKSHEKSGKSGVTLLLKATGDTPIMKKRKWIVEPEKKIGAVIEFMRKYLKLQDSESLFLYVNQSFAPAPDQTVKNVYNCFGADGHLTLHYCRTPAWG